MADNKLTFKPISYSYVAVWKEIMLSVPPFNKVLNDIFGDHSRTIEGLTPEGLAITLQDGSPRPSTLVFGPQRFNLQVSSVDLLLSSYDKFLKHLDKINPSDNYKVKSVGINLFYEVSSSVNLQHVVTSKFLLPTLKEIVPVVHFNDLHFSIVEDIYSNKLLAVLIQRSANTANIIVSINDHYETIETENFFSVDELKAQILVTEEKCTKLLEKVLK